MSIEKIMEKMSEMDYGMLLSTAKYAAEAIQASAFVKEFISQINLSKDQAQLSLLLMFIVEGIGADHSFTEKEKFFISDFTNTDIKTAKKIMKDMHGPKNIQVLDELADKADDSTKAAMIQLVCAVCACDGSIAYRETALVKKLIEK